MAPETRRRWLGALLLLVLVALAWANALHGTFTYDDKVEVIGNRTIRSLADLRAVLGYNVSRPLVVLSWALDFRLWGMDPLGYHLVNLAVHAANAALLLLLVEELARRLGRPRPFALGLAVAATWALHPMTTEAVTYVTGRSESLCTLFILGALVEWLHGWRERDPIALGLSFLSFLLGMATKEVAAVTPLLLLWIEWVLPPEGRRGRRLLLLLPHFLVLAGGLALRKAVNGVFTTPHWLRPLDVQLATEAEVWVRYLRLWLLPVGQSILHDPPLSAGWLSPRTLLSLGLLGGLAAWAALSRRSPWLRLGLGAAAITLLPSSSAIPLKEVMAEHRTYLAGAWLLFALLLEADRRLPAGRWRRPALAALVLLLGLGTHLRNRDWRDEPTLWAQATRVNPRSAEAWYGLGDALRFQQRFEEAVEAYRKAVELDPGYLDAWNNLGIALAEQGRQDEARQVWEELLRKHPTFCKAHNNLAWLAVRQRDWDRAIVEFQSTLSWCPDDAQAHYGLGNIYYGPRRDRERALWHYQELLRVDPHFKYAEKVRERVLALTW